MITVAQIRALSREALTAGQHKDCDVALGRAELTVLVGRHLELWRPTLADRRAARRRLVCLLLTRRAA